MEDEKEYCQWCGCELSDQNRVLLDEDAAKGATVCVCEECATSIFLSNNADIMY